MATSRFRTRQPCFWDRLDVDVTEGDEEAERYNERIRGEVRWKTEGLEGDVTAAATGPAESRALLQAVASDEIRQITPQEAGKSVPGRAKEDQAGPRGEEAGGVLLGGVNMKASELVQAARRSSPAQDVPVIFDEPEVIPLVPASSRPAIPLSKPHLARLRSSNPISTPNVSRLTGHTTLPSIPTPKDTTTPLPAPIKRSSTSRLQQISAQTPDAIASPIDTPKLPSTAASGRTGQAVTPVPLGSGSVVSQKAKKEYLALTEHYTSFVKKLAKDAEKDGAAADKGQAAKVGSRSTRNASKLLPLGLGGKVFDGLRFCIPLEIGPPAKQKNKWEVIHRLGGEVTITPDTATTHVIWDKTSASMLAQQLGLTALSELPERTVIVKWEYVTSCMFSAKLLEPDAFLSIPKNPFNRTTSTSTGGVSGLFKAPTRAGSRLAENGLKGKTTSITRKRAHTPTDSDTESPRKPKKVPSLQGRMTSRNIAAGPSRIAMNAIPTTATTHALPTSLRWEIAPEGGQDGLDALISGVVNGTIKAKDDDEETDEKDARPGPSEAVTDDSDGEDNADPKGKYYKCGRKNDGNNVGPNEWLAKKFDEMHEMYQGVPGKSQFAIRQYMQAASIMRRTLHPITSGQEALKIKGIGQSIADRIDEFINGGPGRLYYEDNEKTRTIAMFKDVYGVGRTMANELYRKGARTMDDLREKDYGLTSGQLVGVELYEDLNSRIPREECRQIYEIIRAEAVAIDPKVWVEIMGSYRRGQETSGDVDILITRDTADGLNHSGVMRRLVDRLMVRGIITHELSAPSDWRALETKWMGVGRLDVNNKHRRIDILAVPFEQWGAALLYFTGNEIFNRSIRLYAHKKGYRLNQQGLFADVIRGPDGVKLTNGHMVASRTEQDIFDVLGLRWRHPHHRRP